MFEFLKRSKQRQRPATSRRLALTAPPDFANALGRWIAVEVPSEPSASPFVGFVYFDPRAGLSAQGGLLRSRFADQPTMTLRLPMEGTELLTDDEVAAWKLPVKPPWLARTNEPIPAPWRNDPALVGRFHPSFINDLQILVHDGEPRRTGSQPEMCWVRVSRAEQGPPRRFIANAAASVPPPRMSACDTTVYLATLLNEPHQLTSVRQADPLCFYADVGVNDALMVSTAYLAERATWRVQPCDRCGLCEGFDPPSAIAKTDLMFTRACVLCDGVQLWSREDP